MGHHGLGCICLQSSAWKGKTPSVCIKSVEKVKGISWAAGGASLRFKVTGARAAGVCRWSVTGHCFRGGAPATNPAQMRTGSRV